MLWITWLMANVCMWMSDVAAAWMMTSLTATPLWVALVAAVVITRWRREHKPHPLGRERLGSAMRIGLQYVAQSTHLKGVLVRISIFFVTSTALVALLPLLARNLEGGGAGTFTLLLACMGSNALGAAVWGQVATVGSVRLSVVLAALTGVAAMVLANRLMPGQGMVEDLTPSSVFGVPQAHDPPAQGHVMVTIEYRIDPARALEFRALMAESRRSRLRHGALLWELLQDINAPGRFVEMIEDASWTEHQRRFDRVTTADVALRDRKLAFHIGESPPLVTRSVMESTHDAEKLML